MSELDVDNATEPTFWGSLVGGVVILVGGLWRLMRNGNGQPYQGPERRREMRHLKEEMAAIDKRLSVLESGVQTVREGQLAIIHRQERADERWRKGDHQTARELGALSQAFQALETMIAHERGWTKPGSRSRSSPPNGYMVTPPDDQTPEPGGDR